MQNFTLSAKNISKNFSARIPIFKNINIKVTNGDIIGITGLNGSGKTTLLKILAGVLNPSHGSVEFNFDNKSFDNEHIYRYLGYVGPYLNLYDEFTPMEHVQIFSNFRGVSFSPDRAKHLLQQFNLHHRSNDLIRTFSSGMKQRMKYVLALHHESYILMLDEPMTNLDQAGITVVMNSIFEHQSKGGAVIIATNDERERAICRHLVQLTG